MSDTTTTAHKSWVATIVGAILWAISGAGSAILGHFIPDAWLAVFHALGALITAIGAATQIHNNTKATVATTTAVQQVTAASVTLTPNPSIVAAQQGIATGQRNPLTNK